MTLHAKTADQTYSAEDVAKLLGISRATFYRLAWFKSRKIHVSTARVVYSASDVTLYQAICRQAA